jgi:hypothetical protein
MPEDNGNGFPTFHTDTATTLLAARQNTRAAMILYLDSPVVGADNSLVRRIASHLVSQPSTSQDPLRSPADVILSVQEAICR